jgi:hypothetical protein
MSIQHVFFLSTMCSEIFIVIFYNIRMKKLDRTWYYFADFLFQVIDLTNLQAFVWVDHEGET